jgi:hypothetical protein
VKQLEDLKIRAEKEIGMSPHVYDDIVDGFLHHPDHTEKELRTQGSFFEKVVGGHSRGGPWYYPHIGKTLPVGASVGATTRKYSDKQLRKYFAPVLEWGATVGEKSALFGGCEVWTPQAETLSSRTLRFRRL